ncbi:MAG: SURF1 family cytochrome oxidase biogenesis protein [Microbacteriaceae bacterium]
MTTASDTVVSEEDDLPRRRMTLREFLAIARRPLWIGVLVLVLAVAAAFAALAQWQVARSVESANVEQRETELVVPLEDLAQTASQVTETQEGQLVETVGEFVDGDYTVISGRLNDGELGFWLVGHVITTSGDSLAIALGWAETEADAAAAERSVPAGEVAIQGRYLGSESPQQSDIENGELSTLAVAELINEWSEIGPVFGGYVVWDDAPDGLETIDAPPPEQQVVLNWLNVFYAAEWVLFAGFAFYLWYRLVKDVWEKETDEEDELAPVE